MQSYPLSCLQDEDIDLKAMCMNVKVNDRNVKMNIILAYGVLPILACSCARMVVSMNKFISTCPLRLHYLTVPDRSSKIPAGI